MQRPVDRDVFFRLYAAEISYFSAKVRPAFRYKRIPHVEILATPDAYRRVIVPRTGLAMIPVVVTPEDETIQDSSDILDALEARFPDPPLFPPTPVQRLAAYLVELHADEFMMLPGLHYRWSFPEGMDIFRADLDGKGLTRLTDANGYDAEGSFSPDGKQIIFTSFRDGDAEVYVMDADGENPRRITNAKGYDGGPFFSPDGKRIIYRSDRKENDMLQLYVNNVEGTDERALTAENSVNWGPFWHPDGRHIIYATSAHGHQNYELYLMRRDGSRKMRITFAEGFDGLPVFSPDGKWLMWSSKRTADKTTQVFLARFTMPD